MISNDISCRGLGFGFLGVWGFTVLAFGVRASPSCLGIVSQLVGHRSSD